MGWLLSSGRLDLFDTLVVSSGQKDRNCFSASAFLLCGHFLFTQIKRDAAKKTEDERLVYAQKPGNKTATGL